jgi:regulator of RNase E activity RraA
LRYCANDVDASALGRARAGREYELLFAAIDGLANGEVLVTDRGDCCVRGELCAEAAMRRGGNGIVINGFTRDSADFRETGKGR